MDPVSVLDFEDNDYNIEELEAHMKLITEDLLKFD